MKKAKFYGIEAELPPDTDNPLMIENGEAIICSAQFGNSAYRCVSHTMMEVFASTAALRWSDRFHLERLSNPQNIEKTRHARKQSELWREIRDKAISEKNR